MNKKMINRLFLMRAHKYITHLLAKLKFLLLSIISMGTFPLDAAHARKQALVGALDFQIALAEKVG